ncbi:beta-1,4-glucuronyltransferase 1 [Scyliorhinus torazame]|uniref:beta-1,4-glucuronyltransferase 1 n=1 Tax=Scyliorhinus torazame TaxID=75743 RepID=UPI003B5A165E
MRAPLSLRRPRSVFEALAASLVLVAGLQLLYLWLLPGERPREQSRRLRGAQRPLARDSRLDASGRYRLYRDVGGSRLPGRGVQFSLATHTSVHNLYQLPALLRRWQAPLALALFALAGEVPQAVLAVQRLQLYCPGVQDRVTFTLVTPSGLRLPALPPAQEDGAEEGLGWDPRLDSDTEPEPHPPCQRALAPLHRLRLQHRNYDLGNTTYPNNLLRNAAREALPSQHVLLIDMDMLPSGGLHAHFLDLLTSRRGASSLQEPLPDRTLYVLPALEIRHSRRVPWDKAELQRLYQVAEVRPFYSELCPRCQAPTNYSRWINLPAGGPGLRVAYTRHWTDPWEPFYISRSTVPPFDERFEQYGFNRISQACELHVAGYSFAVLDNAFLIHKGFKLATEFHPQKDEENRRNRILFRQFKQELKSKYPDSPRRC